MLELRNPVPSSVRDTGKIYKFFRQYGATNGEKKWIIPYYGNSEGSSHTFLQLLKHLTTKSPSYKSAESGIARYAFGGFEDNTFFDTLSSFGIKKGQLLRTMIGAFRHLKQCGNAYIRVSITAVDGVVKVRLKNEHYFYVAYLNSEPGQDRHALVVVDWDYERWGTDLAKPEVIPVSTFDDDFNWHNAGPSTIETLLHIREYENDESDWYGRPDILAVLEWMFSETVLGDHVCKVNSTDLVAKLLLFFEAEEQVIRSGDSDDDEEEDSFTSVIKVLKSIATNDPLVPGKKASGIAAMEYGHQTKPPTAVKLDINRDTSWFTTSLDEGKAMIYSIMGWYRELTGMAQTKTGIGSNILTDLFLVANTGTIEPIQKEFEEYTDILLTEIGKAIGQDWEDKGLTFVNKIEGMVEAIAASRSTTKTTISEDPAAQ